METCADELAQQCLLPIQILSLEPEHRKNRLATTGAVKDHRQIRLRRSSCLRFQLIRVETVSFLPNCQSNGRDFAG